MDKRVVAVLAGVSLLGGEHLAKTFPGYAVTSMEQLIPD